MIAIARDPQKLLPLPFLHPNILAIHESSPKLHFTWNEVDLHYLSERGTPSALADFMNEVSEGTVWPVGLSIREYIRHTTELFRSCLENPDAVGSGGVGKDQKVESRTFPQGVRVARN